MLYVVESLLICAINLVVIHVIIHSILVGNMPYKSYKNAKKHARIIVSSQSWGNRITQIYVRSYITKFVKWYRTYMTLKIVSILLWLLLCFVVILLNNGGRMEDIKLFYKVIMASEVGISLFLCSRFGWLDRRTMYEKDCGNNVG